MKQISILGATGSIGQNTLELITSAKDEFEVVALTGFQNIKLLAQSAIDSNAKIVAISDESKFNELKEMLSGQNIKVLGGKNGILEASSVQVDWVMSAIIGSAGLLPGLTAMQAGANVALANKESMVAAGPIMKKVSEEKGVKLLPVDSEHSAVSQVIRGEDKETLEKIIITASGGAFRNRSIDELKKVTPYEASKHPNWDMGQRITIDSASLFNKALEIIEAKEFFNLNHSEINVLIHPQSIVHAIACFHDQGMKAHLGPADMKHAIAYALHEEKRFRLRLKAINLSEIGTLNFYEPDVTKYPALELGYNVIRHGGLAGAAFNAAKEEALDNFLNLKLSFPGMSDVVSATMDELTASNKLDQVVELEAVMEIDLLARSVAKQYVEKY